MVDKHFLVFPKVFLMVSWVLLGGCDGIAKMFCLVVRTLLCAIMLWVIARVLLKYSE